MAGSMAKRSPDKLASLKAAFDTDAWKKFESLIEATAKNVSTELPKETASKPHKGLRSTLLTRKTPLRRKTFLTRKPK